MSGLEWIHGSCDTFEIGDMGVNGRMTRGCDFHLSRFVRKVYLSNLEKEGTG
jgi:hypothetical protein